MEGESGELLIGELAVIECRITTEEPAEDSVLESWASEGFVVEAAASELIEHAEGIPQPVSPEGCFEEHGDAEVMCGMTELPEMALNGVIESRAVELQVFEGFDGESDDEVVEFGCAAGIVVEEVDSEPSAG